MTIDEARSLGRCRVCGGSMNDLRGGANRVTADEYAHGGCVKKPFFTHQDILEAMEALDEVAGDINIDIKAVQEDRQCCEVPPIPAIGFRLLHPAARQPTRATPGSTGWDIYAVRPATILPHSAGTLETGISVEPPPGWAFCVRPRSGLSRKGIWAATGTIDNDYRGDIGVTLMNWTAAAYYVAAGDRIAQLVLEPVYDCRWEERAELGQTERGAGGFGHTGK